MLAHDDNITRAALAGRAPPLLTAYCSRRVAAASASAKACVPPPTMPE